MPGGPREKGRACNAYRDRRALAIVNWSHVEAGRITRIRVTFDPRPPASRGRGAYRAVLAERLRLAREHGASLALVQGRAMDSGPILLRAGFADYGEEQCYWLPIR